MQAFNSTHIMLGRLAIYHLDVIISGFVKGVHVV